MRTILAACFAATALVAQTGPVIEPHLAGVLEPLTAAQFLLPVHGFSAGQLAYAPVPHPALLAGATTLYVPDPLLCSAKYVGAEVGQLVFALPQGALVLLDASSSLALHVLAVPPLTWSLLAGICIDGEQQQVVLLDADGPSLLRIDLADLRAGTAKFETTPLPPPWSTVRGIAFDFARDRIVGLDPETGTLLQHSVTDPNPSAGTLSPVPRVLAFGFAPAGGLDHDLFVSSGDPRMLTSQWTWSAAEPNGGPVATLRATVATSAWSPASPDPSAIGYDNLRDRLMVSDGEVEEMTIYAGKNVWESSRAGIVSRSTTTLAYSNEPVGMTFQSATRTFYICDDGPDFVAVVATGADGLIHTADDTRRTFSVANIPTDPEDTAFSNATNELWIAGGTFNQVHRLRPGNNGIFDGTPPVGDDQILTIPITQFGVSDIEGIAVRPSDGGIYVIGVPITTLLHLNSSGQFVRTITLPSTGLIKPAGIVFAPRSSGTGDSMYLVDRGIDNEFFPNENDGMMFEYGVPGPNQAPVVNAGPDVTIPLTGAANLAGTVTDDGLPGPLTIQWSKLSGPGTVTFAAPSQAATTAAFSASGSYTLQLSAFDGELTSTDTCVVTVQQAPGGGGTVERTIATSGDDAEEGTSSVNLGSGDIELVADGSVTQTVGLRFQNLAIPAGSVITSAYVQFTTDETGSTPTQLTIAGQASDNAPAFVSTSANISSRPRTTATVAWAPVAWTVVNQTGPNQRTPNLASIVQQITNRPGWSPGNAMVFVITGTGTRIAVAYDGSPALAARLIVNHAVNQAPVVNAGPDVTILLPGAANLAGTVTDDGLPGGPLTIQWSKLSGPGTATFAAPNQAATTAAFSASGSYTLQLSASDGQFTTTDTCVVTVQQNQPPVVNAGPDVTILLPAAANLAGTVTDDGLPGPLTIQWSKLAGPGTATFAAPNQAATSAAFSASGSYTLQLSAFDGEFTTTDTCVVTVQQNQPPVVNAGPDVTILLPAAANLAGTVTDDGLPGGPLTIQWSKLAGPGTATFAAPNQAATTATFSASGSYTLQLSASDGQFTTTDTCVVTVQQNQPPVVNAGPDVTIPLTAAANLAGTVTDDGLPGPLTIQWSKLSGPGTVTFAAPNQAATTATFSASGSYTLQLSAFDGQFTTTDTCVVTVQQPNQPPVVNAGPDVTILLTAAANLAGTVTDDGLPGPLTIQWSKLSGPGTVTFAAPNQAATTATFSASGSYTLQLSASDGQFTTTDACVVTVQQPPGGSVTVERVIATGGDDAEEEPTSVKLDSSDLELVVAGSVTQTVGLRFVNLTIPAGSVITSAYVQFTTDEATSTPTQLTIAGQASDNAPAFTETAANISSRPRTTATVAWAPVAWTIVHEAGANQRTPNLASIVQQIVNRPGWSPGNAMVLVITGTGSRVASAFDDSAVFAAKLIVNHAPGTPVNQPPVVNAGPDVTILPTAAANLAGTVTDDGLPGPLTIQWSKLSGPGTATFAAPTQAATTATFSLAGSYTLQLSAFDGEFTSTDTCVVTVQQTPGGTAVERVIATSSDDAEEGSGSVNRTSGDLELVVDGSETQTVGLRFQNLTIPAGSVITSAYVQFTTDETGSTPTQLTIAGQASDNAPTFTATAANISSRPRTTATVAWAPVAWTVVNQAGLNQRTPNLASIVQQIVSRPGWSSGNAIVLVITGTGTRIADAYDGSPAAAARLIVNHAVNQPPVVNAGPDVTILLPAAANLEGSVTDDGLPGPLTIQWSKLSGPGTATFAAPNQAATTAAFSASGSYTLQLSAFDGEFTTTDTCVVTVQQNQPPVVNAGPDVTILLPAAANLEGSVTDDGLPGPLTIQWSKLSGPGTATFAAPNQAATTAAFSASGSYTLQLSAFDGEFTTTDTCVVTVQQNQPPVVNAGPDVTIVLTGAATLAGTVTDDGLPGGPLTIQWSKLSGPGTATFAAPSQAATTAAFSASGSYTLQLSAFDGEFTSTDTCVVTVQQPPTAIGGVECVIATSDDDAEESPTSVIRGSNDLELVVDGSVNQVVGLRFQNVTIPAGSVITSAYVQFTADGTTSTPTLLTIQGQASDNPTAFAATAANISSRPRTTATVAWAPVAWTVVHEAGPNQRTPDLANIVQEITNRPGWSPGNAMVFVIQGTGTRTASAYDTSTALAARLIVNYQ